MKISEILKLFKAKSCENKVEYELFKTECPDGYCFWIFMIYYYTNLYSIVHNKPNELEIVIGADRQVSGIEFESAGDRCDRTPAWKAVCKCIADDLVLDIDLEENYEN